MDNRRTFSDQVELLSLIHDVDEKQRARKLARLAISGVYQEIALSYEWTHLRRSALIYWQEPYSTGTVSVSGTTATLTGGTWPAWAGDAVLFAADERWQAIERVSSTVLRLDPNHAPEANLSGESYELALGLYDLPADFGKLIAAWRTDSRVELQLLWDKDWSAGLAAFTEPATPLYAQVTGTRGGRLMLEFQPPPSDAEYVRVDYRRKFRPFGTGKYSTGTISIATRTVTGVGTTFPADAEGMILRVGTADNEPTSQIGEAPYQAAYTVARRVSDTELILAEDATTVSAVKYTLDDPIDIDPDAMQELFDRMVEARFARLAQLDIRNEAEQRAQIAFGRARAMDHRPVSPNSSAIDIPLVTWSR